MVTNTVGKSIVIENKGFIFAILREVEINEIYSSEQAKW